MLTIVDVVEQDVSQNVVLDVDEYVEEEQNVVEYVLEYVDVLHVVSQVVVVEAARMLNSNTNKSTRR